MSKPMKRIAVYYRVSTDKQDFESQKYAIDQWLASLPDTKKPSSIVTFEDFGRSGKDSNRPGFKAMLAAADASEIDTIVVYRLDRFSRDANTALRSILDLDSKGVAFISVSQPVLNLGHDNPFRRTMLCAFAEISQLERETTVARIKSGLEAAKLRGSKLGRPRGSNYKDETIVRLRAEGKSIRRVARMARVSKTTVMRVLKEAKSKEGSVQILAEA